MFVRDENRHGVLDKITPGCEWVAEGQGIATRKIDGTCCMVRGGKLFKRREVKAGQPEPEDFLQVDRDNETGKTVGWVPVSETDPGDARHREAFGMFNFPDGTYELIGPKVQSNPEQASEHQLIRHGMGIAGPIEGDVPRDYAGLAAYLRDGGIEGIVFHHPDGRMAKIKARDFGLKRALKEQS